MTVPGRERARALNRLFCAVGALPPIGVPLCRTVLNQIKVAALGLIDQLVHNCGGCGESLSVQRLTAPVKQWLTYLADTFGQFPALFGERDLNVTPILRTCTPLGPGRPRPAGGASREGFR